MSDYFVAIKAVGDWELDINVLPFQLDTDGQWFDPGTDTMSDKFSSPLIVYQHGVKQGGHGIEDKPVILGDPIPGSLRLEHDGWHINAIIDKTIRKAKEIMEAAKNGLLAVSSGSISHLARLDIGGKLHMYDKTKPGRIAVWPIAEVSLWERGGGNFEPANKHAYALPAMKAIYRDAGLQFPEIIDEPNGAPQVSELARKRAKVIEQSKQILNKGKKLRRLS